MAYSKQTWDTTSYVNPTRMNHIEDGIYSADTKTADDIPYSSGVSVKTQIDKKAGKVVINTLNSSSFSYDSSTHMWASNNPITYYYGQRKVLGMYVVPTSYLATMTSVFLSSSGIICVIGILFPNGEHMDGNATFQVKIAMEDYS